jgi:hypothetical protein
MRLFVLGFVFALGFVAPAVAGHQGWDDLSCNELFTKLAEKNIISKHERIKDAFCKYDYHGESLELLLDANCTRLHLDSYDCENMKQHLESFRGAPSKKFKDFWDWRAHHKRLSDYWLLPLSQYCTPLLLFVTIFSKSSDSICSSPRSLLFYLYFQSDDTLVVNWFTNQLPWIIPESVLTPSVVMNRLWNSDAFKKHPDPKSKSFLLE